MYNNQDKYYTYHEFIQNYEPIVTVEDNISMEAIG